MCSSDLGQVIPCLPSSAHDVVYFPIHDSVVLGRPAIVVKQVVRVFVRKAVGDVLAGAVLQHHGDLMLYPQPLGEVLSRFITHSVWALKLMDEMVIVLTPSIDFT